MIKWVDRLTPFFSNASIIYTSYPKTGHPLRMPNLRCKTLRICVSSCQPSHILARVLERWHKEPWLMPLRVMGVMGGLPSGWYVVTEMLFNIFYRWCLKALNFILNLYNLNIYCICISFNVSISGSYMSLVTCFRVLTPAGSDLCKSRSIEAHDGRCFSL